MRFRSQDQKAAGPVARARRNNRRSSSQRRKWTWMSHADAHSRRAFSRAIPDAASKAIEPGESSQSFDAGMWARIWSSTTCGARGSAAPSAVPSPTTVTRTALLAASATKALLRGIRRSPFIESSTVRRPLWAAFPRRPTLSNEERITNPHSFKAHSQNSSILHARHTDSGNTTDPSSPIPLQANIVR